ncbi:MAG: NUDIX domain-containing protein [Candidatus Nanohaloarchaea archaeon]|nr:NUDIX domain-containing protein [Candidatus Nanohaloarchaea archaeon]
MKQAVALVIYRDSTGDEVLSVLRPEDDDDHPGMWGLPATSLDTDETWEDAVHRAAEEKLGVAVEMRSVLSEGTQSRPDYHITLRNYAVDIVDGDPEVPQDGHPGTQYEDWDWKAVEQLRETAEDGGSLCTSLLLDYHGHEFDVPSNITATGHIGDT